METSFLSNALKTALVLGPYPLPIAVAAEVGENQRQRQRLTRQPHSQT